MFGGVEIKMTERGKHARVSPADLKKKRFYAAIYSSVAVMLLIAAVVGYFNLNSGEKNRDDNNSLAVQTIEPDTAQVGLNLDESYMPGYNKPDPFGENPDTNGGEAGAEASSDTVIQPGAGLTDTDVFDDDIYIAVDPDKDTAKTKPSESPAETVTPGPSQTASPGASGSSNQAPEFTAFTEGSQMEWPVLGEIVMNYSMDHLVYDKTLEQYRTNNSVSIAADVGSQVHASADGIVSEIFTSRELGKSVVLDHGNGWKTTYSQLQDNVLVKQGDVVKAGQAIGGVGSPSIYSLMLGNHLTFSVTSNEQYVNPNTVLKK